MANDFESFIQLELPKRPFLEVDPAKETVIVRRGQGARQLQGVTINEGEVLGMVNGTLASVPMSAAGAVALAHTQTDASKHWTIQNSQGNVNAAVSVYDANGKLILADEVIITAEQIDIFFIDAQAGRAVFIFA